MFHIRASYWLPSLSFHDNRASHSLDTIWPWKFKVKGQGQRSRSKVKVKGTLVSVAPSWLIWFPFYFTSIGPTIPKIWQIECSTGENGFKILRKKLLKKILGRISPKVNQVESMMRGIYLPSFVSIGWAVLTLPWGQGRLCSASVA